MRSGANGIAIRSARSKLFQIAADAVLHVLHAGAELMNGQITIPVVDCLELAAVNGNHAVGQQVELPANGNEATADLADRRPVVSSEIRNGLEVRGKAASQPDQLQIALSLSLKPAAGLHAVEVAVDVDLQQRRRVI